MEDGQIPFIPLFPFSNIFSHIPEAPTLTETRRGLGYNTYLDELRAARKHVVILDDRLELREMPAVPFLDTHRKCIEVFVELIQESDALDNHIIRTTGIKLDARTRVGMAETELCLLKATLSKLLDEGCEMLPEARRSSLMVSSLLHGISRFSWIAVPSSGSATPRGESVIFLAACHRG